MLSDIQAWSCWGHLFAPTLGPIVKWLETEVHTNELLCLVTINGKVIRIDPTATVDRLLKASFDHSPVRAATQLLSLLALNWKEMHIIVDCLKSHTCGPIEQFCRCLTHPGGKYWTLMHKDSTRLKPLMVEHPGNAAQETAISKAKKSSNEVVSAVSKFILEILGYLPPEFRIVATNVLLPGLAKVTKDAPSALLCECCNTEQLLMLREVGLSLHISEWIKDVRAFLPDSGSLHGPDKAFSDHDQSNLSGGEFDHDFKQHSPELDEDQDKTPPLRQEKFFIEPGRTGADDSISDSENYLAYGEFDHDHSRELDEDQDKNPLVRQENFVTEPGPTGADDSISDSENYRALLQKFLSVLSRLYPYGPFGLLVPVTQILLDWAKDFEYGLLVSDDIKYLKRFLLELETKLLPLKGKWVPQHPYNVCVCSRADEELLNHLNHSDAMKIIHLSYLGNCEKGVLQQNIAVILEAIGIPTLSKVVNRVAVQPVLPRTTDGCSKASLVSRALYKTQVYFNKSEFEAKEYILQRLSHLEIFEVEKLAYNYAIRKLKVFSKRQFECSCLQQGKILYITPDSDSREISLELAQELVNGNPNRMANLFDLYITMEELNGQTEPMVSDGSSFHESAGTSQIANEKTGIKNDQSLPGNSHHRSINCIVEIFNKRDQNTDPYGQHKEALVYFELNVGSCEQNRANTGRHDEATKTGREGERRAFKHLKKKYGAGNVEWKNAKEESKLPFDFIIWEDECQKVIKWYVEVKATNYARKNCFTISHAEFKCAYTHGEKYVIMHICLANGARRFFEDPVKQLRQDKLRCSHMDILMPG